MVVLLANQQRGLFQRHIRHVTCALMYALLMVATVQGYDDDYVDIDHMDNPLDSDELLHDKGHLADHITQENIDPSNLSPEELEFHFFRLHDLNKDSQLDGLEMYHSVTHAADRLENVAHLHAANDTTTLRLHITVAVDKMLVVDDKDHDGYLSWTEFRHARSRQAKKLLKTK